MRHLCLAALVGVCLAPLALARIINNTIDPVAIVSGNGLHVVLTGPIACTEGERASLRVTVTQRETGALAEGVALFTCTGVIQAGEGPGPVPGKGAVPARARPRRRCRP